MKRTQIYLDEGQDKLIQRIASRDGLTKSEVIRRTLDSALDENVPVQSEWSDAVHAAAGIWSDAMDGKTYVDQLRSGRWLEKIDRLFNDSK